LFYLSSSKPHSHILSQNQIDRSYNNMASTINLLDYVRTKTQIDCDSVDLEVVKTYGPFVDCTSNQADSYIQFLRPQRAELLNKTITYARNIHHEFPGIKIQELAVELCMVSVTLEVIPFISGSIHIMANPSLSYSTSKLVENGKRIAHLCKIWDPSFDIARLCIKVPSTWEGLQACRILVDAGIKTLATTLFTMEQAILAAEVGCTSISPFVHELKVQLDDEYHDVDPILDLCVKAQRYFETYSYKTRVKACSLINVEEILMLAGVSALTLPPPLLEDLQTADSDETLSELSLFATKIVQNEPELERFSFLDDEKKFREKFSKNEDGKGKLKTEQAIQLFCEYQTKAEALMETLI